MYCMGISLVSKRGDKSTVKFLHLNFLANSAPPTSETISLPKSLVSDWVTHRQFLLEDTINNLREREGMRRLGGMRGEQVSLLFEKEAGTPAVYDRILRDLQEKGLSSRYYNLSKIDRSLPVEKDLIKFDRDVTQ